MVYEKESEREIAKETLKYLKFIEKLLENQEEIKKMIDWKKEYNRLYKCLLLLTVLMIITLIMLIATICVFTEKLKEKGRKITEYAIEIVDLRETSNERRK